MKPSDFIRKRAKSYIKNGETVESAHDHAIMDYLDEQYESQQVKDQKCEEKEGRLYFDGRGRSYFEKDKSEQSEKLLPCPFCGGEATYVSDPAEVWCKQCCFTIHDECKEATIKWWNTRKSKPCSCKLSVEEIYYIMNNTKCRTFDVKTEFWSLHDKGIYNLTLYTQAEAIHANLEGK